MKKIAVFGLGRVGKLVALMLADEGFDVVGVDRIPPTSFSLPFQQVNVQDEKSVKAILSRVDAVASCLPYHWTLHLAKLAYSQGVHYFDLTEDRETTLQIQQWSNSARAVLVPQCGLAPGFICIAGADLVKGRSDIVTLGLRVGALDASPKGFFRYSLTWSPEGVVNEYLNPCEAIVEGQIVNVPARSSYELLSVDGKPYEAASTSGGLGTLCQTLLGQVQHVNYKSIRYVGHFQRLELLFDNPFLKPYRKILGWGLQLFSGTTSHDQVLCQAFAINKEGHRSTFEKVYHPIVVGGESWNAISWTTAGSLVAVITLVAQNKLPQQGFIAQESIRFQDFLSTKTGSLFK
jgi:saccharopine dehydrogenase-like NADP-dependent oxidoreductase